MKKNLLILISMTALLANLGIKANEATSIVPKIIQQATELRKQKISELKHIPTLEISTKKLLEYTKEKGETIDPSTYKIFFQEAQERIKSKNITYQWWVLFHFRMSVLITPLQSRAEYAGEVDSNFENRLIDEELWKTHDGLIRLIDEEFSIEAIKNAEDFFEYLSNFKEKTPELQLFNIFKVIFDPDHTELPLLWPIIDGNFTVREINQTIGSSIFLIGFMNEAIKADGRTMHPHFLFYHDLIHFSNLTLVEELSTIREIHQNYLRVFASKNLFTEQELKEFDFVFFLLMHERSRVDLLSNDMTLERMLNLKFPIIIEYLPTRNLSFMEALNYHYWYAPIIPENLERPVHESDFKRWWKTYNSVLERAIQD